MFTRTQRGCVIQRCQNKNPRSKLGPGDVNDITHWKRELRIWGFEKRQCVEFLPLNESWDSDLGEARQHCALWAPCIGWVESWRCKSSQHRKIVSLSPYVEKPLNSKRWIKVSYLNQFCIFGFLYMFMNILWTLCLFYISVSWVCYTCSSDLLNMDIKGLLFTQLWIKQ